MQPFEATEEQSTQRPSRGVALQPVWPRPLQFTVPTPKGASSHCVARVDAMVQRIMTDFEDIACQGIPTREPKHGFEHVIETEGEPVCSPCRRLDPARLAAARAYFKQMEA